MEQTSTIFVEFANENTVGACDRGNFKVGTLCKQNPSLSTEKSCIPSFNLNALSYTSSDDFGRTGTIYRGRFVLSSENNGKKVYGRIEKRGAQGLVIASKSLLAMNQNMKTLASPTSKQSTRASRTSATLRILT